MDALVHDLNYGFNMQVFLFENLVDNLNDREKAIAIAWVNKLKTNIITIQEARLRNDFLYYLVKCCDAGRLIAPFREKPPRGSIINLIELLPPEKKPKLKRYKFLMQKYDH